MDAIELLTSPEYIIQAFLGLIKGVYFYKRLSKKTSETKDEVTKKDLLSILEENSNKEFYNL